MKFRRILTVVAVALMLAAPQLSRAQKLAVNYNAGDLVFLGTIGAGVDYAFAQHWSAGAEARFNPWTFAPGDCSTQTEYRHQTYSLGVRYWPWYVYSGWFAGFKAQYQEYNRGGFGGRLRTEEGDAYGLGIDFGYAWMLTHSINLNLGLGVWGGYTKYTNYSCPYCGTITGRGSKPFILPNELFIALVYVF